MAYFCSLTEVVPDDVLSDWRRFCLARGMSFGVAPGEGVHTIAVASEEHRLQISIGQPCGATARETLDAFLSEHLRRHPHLRLVESPTEQALLDQTKYEGCLGFIIR